MASMRSRLSLIHPSAWKGNSAKFALIRLSEVPQRYRKHLGGGESLKPSEGAYILHPSAYTARSGPGNRSSPSTMTVGLPGNRTRCASSSVLTATSWISASIPSW
jgi:hypothetical protein